MSLVTNIQTIVTTLYPSATFKFVSEFHANEQSNTVTDFPLIILDNTIRKRAIINPNANVTKRTTLRMFFLTKHSNKSNINQTDSEMNGLIESMEQIADDVFLNIYQLDSVRRSQNEISEYEIIPRFKIFSSVLSGVEVTANWRENNILRWCKTPRVDD